MLVRITYPVVQWVQWKPNTAKITKRGVCGCERCGQVLWRLASIVVITPQYTDALEVLEEMVLELGGSVRIQPTWWWCNSGSMMAAPLLAVSMWAVSVPLAPIQPTWVGFRRWWCSSCGSTTAPLLAVGSVFSMWAVSVPLAPIQPTWVGFRRWWCSSCGVAPPQTR
jgi:hypothetical protein